MHVWSFGVLSSTLLVSVVMIALFSNADAFSVSGGRVGQLVVGDAGMLVYMMEESNCHGATFARRLLNATMAGNTTNGSSEVRDSHALYTWLVGWYVLILLVHVRRLRRRMPRVVRVF